MTIVTTDVSTADRKWVYEEIVPVKIQKESIWPLYIMGILLYVRSPRTRNLI